MKNLTYVIIILVVLACDNNAREQYYENGQVKSKIIRQGDTLRYTDFYKNGIVSSEYQTILSNNKEVLHGEVFEYYNNGFVENHYYVNKGTIEGEAIEYDLSNRVKKISFYDQGKSIENRYYSYSKDTVLIKIGKVQDSSIVMYSKLQYVNGTLDKKNSNHYVIDNLEFSMNPDSSYTIDIWYAFSDTLSMSIVLKSKMIFDTIFVTNSEVNSISNIKIREPGLYQIRGTIKQPFYYIDNKDTIRKTNLLPIFKNFNVSR